MLVRKEVKKKNSHIYFDSFIFIKVPENLSENLKAVFDLKEINKT